MSFLKDAVSSLFSTDKYILVKRKEKSTSAKITHA